MDAPMNMHESLGSDAAGIESFARAHRRRSGNMGTQLVVSLRACIIRRRIHVDSGIALRARNTVYCEESVVGRYQHTGHANVIESTPRLHVKGHRLAGR